MKRTSSNSELPLIANQQSNGLDANSDQVQNVDVPLATPPQMRTPAVAEAETDSDIAERGEEIVYPLPSTETVLAMMSELVANSTLPIVRLQASTPVRRSMKDAMGHDEQPNWPGEVRSNGKGTVQLSVNSNDPHIAEIEAILREQSCITNFYYSIKHVEGQSIGGLHHVCAGLQENRGLKNVMVWDLAPTPRAYKNPDEIFLICDAVRDHPDLKTLVIPPHLLVHGAALNKEVSAAHSKLPELCIELPESQQQLDAFANALEHNQWLTNLTIKLTARSATNHDRLARALANHRVLTHFHVIFNDGTSDGCTLFGGLAASQSLRDLTVAKFNDCQARGLRDCLANSQSIRNLLLRWLRLSAEGGTHIAAGLDRNLSIVNATLIPMIGLGVLGFAETNTQVAQAMARARRRNTLLLPLHRSVLVGHGISARMALDRPYGYEPILPPEVGILIAEAVAIHLDADDAERIYDALWPT